MQVTDEEICKLLREHQEKGLKLLFVKYYRSLVLWADTFLNNLEDAEDLVQEFFINLWEKRSKQPLIASTLKTYLFISVKNHAINSLKKLNPSKEFYPINTHIDVQDIEYNDLHEQLLSRLEKEIENLPPQSKKVIKCVYLKGMHYQEAADELNVSISTIKTLLVNSLKKLRKNMEGLNHQILFFFLKKSLNPFNRF